MTKLIDLTGQRFGCLVVKEREGTHCSKRPEDGHRDPTWRCYCDPAFGGCGRECIVIGNNLRHGRTKSCGCRGQRRLRNG